MYLRSTIFTTESDAVVGTIIGVDVRTEWRLFFLGSWMENASETGTSWRSTPFTRFEKQGSAAVDEFVYMLKLGAGDPESVGIIVRLGKGDVPAVTGRHRKGLDLP